MNHFMQEAQIGVFTLIGIGRLGACLHVVINDAYFEPPRGELMKSGKTNTCTCTCIDNYMYIDYA